MFVPFVPDLPTYYRGSQVLFNFVFGHLVHRRIMIDQVKSTISIYNIKWDISGKIFLDSKIVFIDLSLLDMIVK